MTESGRRTTSMRSRATDGMLLGRAESALRRCESRIQGLVAEAAALSQYDEIERLTGFARSLDEMARRARSAQLTDTARSSSTVRTGRGAAEERAAGREESAESRAEQASSTWASRPAWVPDLSWPPNATREPSAPRGRARRPSSRAGFPATGLPGTGYPRFAREGDDLVKVGWSKSRDDEYAQRADRSQVEAVSSWLADRGPTSAPISIDDILAIRETDGSEIPSYQVYVVLAWLRQQGLVERIGRKGYAVTDTHQLGDNLAKHWNALPVFSARSLSGGRE